MNAPDVFGRSYTHHSGLIGGTDAVNHGYNFQEQWERALQLDPQFIFVTGWNEWIAGRYERGDNNITRSPTNLAKREAVILNP